MRSLVNRLKRKIFKVTSPNYYVYSAMQLVFTLAFVWALFQGFAWYWWAVAGVGYFFYYCIGMTVGFHRYFTHKSFQAPQWARWLMLVCGTLGGQSSIVHWSMTHLNHHRYPDKPGDPHSPRDHGWKLLLVAFYPQPNYNPYEARKMLRHRDIRFVHHYHNVIVLFWALLLLSISWKLLLFAWVIPFAWTITASLLMITWGHTKFLSYRNYDVNDDSQNVPLLAMVNFGEALHNNHHKWPGRWNFAVKWYEVDMASWVVRLLRKRG